MSAFKKCVAIASIDDKEFDFPRCCDSKESPKLFDHIPHLLETLFPIVLNKIIMKYIGEFVIYDNPQWYTRNWLYNPGIEHGLEKVYKTMFSTLPAVQFDIRYF